MSTSQSFINRRSFISVGFASALLAPQAVPLIARQASSPTAAALLDTMLSSPDRAQALNALVETFARSGIAVFDDAVTAPLIPPSNPVSPLSFQLWQLDALVEELATESHRPAEDFDALMPAQTEDGNAVLTAGDLLAGYYGGATTPGADFCRAYLDRVIPETTHVTAAELPFPTVIASLLGGEMLGQMYDSLGWAAMRSTHGIFASGVATGSAHAFGQIPGIDLPGLPPVPAIPSIEIPILEPLGGATVCGMAQSFISLVQQRIFAVLDAAKSATSGIPIIGEIVSVVIDGVRIGLESIAKAVDIVLAPVTAIIKSIGAGLAIASQIIGTISPWTVTIDLVPPINRFGVGAEVVTGEIDVTAGGWDRIDFPPIIQECASLAGLTLPEPTSKDSPAIVSARQNRPLITLDATDLRLDDVGKASTTYVTENETPEQAKGTEVYGVAWIHVTVEREDLKRLRDDLMDILFSQLPATINKVVRPIIGPAADQFTSSLINLLNVSRKRMLIVVYHEPPVEPTAAPADAEVDETNCVAGTYIAVDPVAILRVALPDSAPITYDGNIVWTFEPNGSVSAGYDGFIVYINGGTPAEFAFSFAGSATGSYTAADGAITVTITESFVTMDAQMIGIEGIVGGDPGSGTVSGTYTCGGSIVFTIDLGEYGTVLLELQPID